MLSLDYLFENAANNNLKSVVLGMPHRGRLNLLTGLLKYPAMKLFHKIKGNPEFPMEEPGFFIDQRDR